jgi:acetylornithine deacetylase/succinyl-diaminopimelate desuccinylase-like protein
MLRGNCADQVTIHAASRDLHSGMYGSAAANPIHVLTRILADMHDDTGRITIPGFYDGVSEISGDLKAQWDKLGFVPADFLGEVGLGLPAGETAYSALEQIWSRPTAEVNGIWGGYIGAGFKTVIPAEATRTRTPSRPRSASSSPTVCRPIARLNSWPVAVAGQP